MNCGWAPSALIRRLCSRWSKRTPPRPRRRRNPRHRPAWQRRALGSRVRDEGLSRALTRSVMDYLAQFIDAETAETFAAFRRARNITSVERPHHRRLLLPGPDALHNAKVSNGVVFRGRDFQRVEVQEVRVLAGVVRHQIIRDDRMRRVACGDVAEEVYILATLIEYMKKREDWKKRET